MLKKLETANKLDPTKANVRHFRGIALILRITKGSHLTNKVIKVKKKKKRKLTVEGTVKVVKSKCTVSSVTAACDTLAPGPRRLLTDQALKVYSSRPKFRRADCPRGEFGKGTSGFVGFSLTFLSIPGLRVGRRQVKGQSSFKFFAWHFTL